MRKSCAPLIQSRAVRSSLSTIIFLCLLLSNIGPVYISWGGDRAEAVSQVPNYIFVNEVQAHGQLAGGTDDIGTDSSGIQGDLIVRNYTDLWLTLSVTATGGASVNSDDVFVGFGVLPPRASVTYHGSYDQIGQNVRVSAQYDFNAWLWNTADTILRLIPGASMLNPGALGETLTAINGLNSVEKAATELQAIKTDGWLSVPGHVLASANELRKLATDDQQAQALQAILARVGKDVSRDKLKDALILLSIYEELKHIVHIVVFNLHSALPK